MARVEQLKLTRPWLARQGSGDLILFSHGPRLLKKKRQFKKVFGTATLLPNTLFKNVTYENSPVRISVEDAYIIER